MHTCPCAHNAMPIAILHTKLTSYPNKLAFTVKHTQGLPESAPYTSVRDPQQQ
jgi:hypothetical protein